MAKMILTKPRLGDTSADVFNDMQEPTGFVNRTDSLIDFITAGSPSVRTFAIQPSGSSYDYYIHGVKYTETTLKSIAIPNVTGMHYIYFDTNQALITTQTWGEFLILDVALACAIYWNATTQEAIYVGDERHGINMDGQTHLQLHLTIGTAYLDGLAIGGTFVPDVTSPTDADVQIDSTPGTIRDEDLSHDIVDTGGKVNTYDLEQEISPIAQMPVMFRQGASAAWAIKPADNFPFIYSDGVFYTGPTDGLPPWNEFTGGAWQLTEASDNSYFFFHVLATNDINHPMVVLQGIETYNSVPSGRTEAAIELSQMTGMPFAEFTPIASFIVQARTLYTNTPQVRFRETDESLGFVDWRDLPFSSTTGGGGVSDHGNLAGLLDDDHPQYTTDAYDVLTDGITTLNASGRSNTIEFSAGTGIGVTVAAVGSPSVDTVTVTNTAPSPAGLTISIINSVQPMLTLVDTTRGVGSPPAGKTLSVAEQSLAFSENLLGANDWLEVGNAVDADSGYIADFDGTVVYGTGHCENTGINAKNIHLFINGVDQGSIGTLSGGTGVSFINNTLDVDFVRGDKIRLQAQQGTGGNIQDTVVKLTVKWRV